MNTNKILRKTVAVARLVSVAKNVSRLIRSARH